MDDDFAALFEDDDSEWGLKVAVYVADVLAPAALLCVEEEFSQVSPHGPNQTGYSLT